MSGWVTLLTAKADQDIETILNWTYEQFGPLQMDAYTGVIGDALEALTEGPQLVGLRWRPELGDGVATLHVARQGRKGRHLLVIRVHDSKCVIEVLRILHDSMDLQRNLDS